MINSRDESKRVFIIVLNFNNAIIYIRTVIHFVGDVHFVMQFLKQDIACRLSYL